MVFQRQVRRRAAARASIALTTALLSFGASAQAGPAQVIDEGLRRQAERERAQ